MSAPFLLFPPASPGQGLGATPEARPASTRPALPTPPFSQWLQRAQPAAPAQAREARPAAASAGTPPSAAPETSVPEAVQPPRAEAAQDKTPDETSATLPAASQPPPAAHDSPPPGAWWLALSELTAADPALPCDGEQGVEAEAALLLVSEGADKPVADGRRLKPQADDAAAAGDLAAQASQAPAKEASPALEAAEAGLADPAAWASPPASAAPASRSLDALGPPPLPLAAGLTPPTAPAGGPHAPAGAAPLSQTLSTPVHDPDFPDALAQRITLLTRQGVQEAHLHLNPAEMGPVSVHIAVSGQQAQVEFAASAAATRSALEASLSNLAAALHGAGLTLTGGGVSQEAPSRRPAPDGAAAGSRRGCAETADASPPVTRPIPRAALGRLDVYA